MQYITFWCSHISTSLSLLELHCLDFVTVHPGYSLYCSDDSFQM